MGSMDEIAKHTSKTDCWVVLHNRVLNVTNFLKDHPGGELAILTFAGKDASSEFDMIHPPDVIEKYAPDAVIGMVGGAGDATPGPNVGGVRAQNTKIKTWTYENKAKAVFSVVLMLDIALITFVVKNFVHTE